jgi:hypothetical protein
LYSARLSAMLCASRGKVVMLHSLASNASLLVAGLLLAAPQVARAQDAEPPSAAESALAPVPLPLPASEDSRETRKASSLRLRSIRSWSEGEPVPAGYHPESRRRRGLLTGGACLLGVPYLLTLTSALLTSTSGGHFPEVLYIPIAGPIIEAVQMAQEPLCYGIDCRLNRTLGLAVSIIDGVLQVAGAAMIVVGIFVRHTVLVPDEPGIVSVAPVLMGRGGLGLGVLARF